MGCRGFLFAIEEPEAQAMVALSTHDERAAYFNDHLWSKYTNTEHFDELEVFWDGIHTCFDPSWTAYSDVEVLSEPVPDSSLMILGGRNLRLSDRHVMVLKSPDQVRRAFTATRFVSKSDLWDMFKDLPLEWLDDGDDEAREEDFEGTWSYFEGAVLFYARASQAGRHVLFFADQ